MIQEKDEHDYKNKEIRDRHKCDIGGISTLSESPAPLHFVLQPLRHKLTDLKIQL